VSRLVGSEMCIRDRHYEGECFVFDERVGVDSSLHETDSVLCYNCQMPLLPSDLRHEHYVYEKTCHHCFHGKPKGRGNTAKAKN
jgi:UPF0176 protein